jgi:hypothetical protein
MSDPLTANRNYIIRKELVRIRSDCKLIIDNLLSKRFRIYDSLNLK